QRREHRLEVGPALGWIGRERPPNHPPEPRRRALLRLDELALERRERQRRQVVAGEGPDPEHRLVGRDPERELIAERVGGPALEQLRGHVGRGPHDRAGLGQLGERR
ncbi:hypothetical protein RZS08_53150, partial [Arthrospira platensis SPKY1]|nr:hypothetical protein [Arthrospira platensis SPKY1]